MQYVALLRGIGPGNPNMRNEKLRGVFESLGFDNVRSVISSGNILFETDKKDVPELEATIERALTKNLGINRTTIIRSKQQIQKLIDARPFGDLDHSRETYLTVTFLKNKPDSEPEPHQIPGHSFEITAYFPAEIALCAVNDTTVTKTPDFMTKLEKKFGKYITTRTYKTVERILAKL